MIHIKTFSGYSVEDCFRHINEEIDDTKVINVIPSGSKREIGYDEYDTWTTYYVDVIYRD